MVNISPRGSHNYSGSSEGAGAVVVLAPVGLAIWSVVTLFSISAVLCVFTSVFVILAAVLMEPAGLARHDGWIRFLLGLDIVLALAATPLVFFAHAVRYPVMGGAITGIYVLALVIGLWSELKGFLKFLAGLFAAAMVAALVILPAPGAAAGDDEASKWKVVLTVRDANGDPIPAALGQCTTIMVWERGRNFVVKPENMLTTDETGKIEFTFHADTRLKAAFCGAVKFATSTEEGYAPRTGVVPNPFRGGTFPLTITLDERTPVGGDTVASGPTTTAPAVSPPSAAPYEAYDLPAEVADALSRARGAASAADALALEAQSAAAQGEAAADEARRIAALAEAAANRAARDEPGTHAYATADGYAYGGEYASDQRHGYGVGGWSAPSPHDGARYAGGWSYGARAGYGVQAYEFGSESESHAGAYANDETTGYGVSRWRDGDTYAGAFLNGKKHGLGVYRNHDGTVSAGQWADGQRNGPAVQAMPDGDVYAGEFRDGRRNGYGVYRFASGQRYEGQWVDGRRHGYGVGWTSDGRVLQAGVWRDGTFAGAGGGAAPE